MRGRCGTIVASMQLGRTPPLLTVPSLSDHLSHSPPTSSSSLSHFYEGPMWDDSHLSDRLSHSPPTSSSSLSHFYVGPMWDDSRLHAARSYTSSPSFSLRSSFTQSAHLFFIFIPLPCGTIVTSQIVFHTVRPPLLHLYPTSMWGRCGTIVASMQLGRTPPLLTVPSLSDRLSHSPPTSSSSLSHFYVGPMWDDSRLHAARSYTSSPHSPFSLRSSFTQPPTSSSSLSHFYVGSMWDDSRLHAARSYTSSPHSPFSLRSSFTQSAHLFIFIPLLCGVDVGR